MKIISKDEKKIDEILEDKRIESFKIGKTSEQDINERKNQEDYRDEYDEIILIREGEPSDIAIAEDALINYVKSKPKCDNENAGSAGSEGNKLYVVVKYRK